jgi:hypothetical protein
MGSMEKCSRYNIIHEGLHKSPLNPPACVIIPILRQNPDVVFVR